MVCVNITCCHYNEFNKCKRWEYMNCGYRLKFESEKENKGITICPSCKEAWDTEEYNSCSCGAIIKNKPIENKVIFENREEFKSFVDDILCNTNNISDIINNAEQKGYIRKSIVEEAEKIIYPLSQIGITAELKPYQLRIIKDAIQELKSEIERLKNANR